MSVPYDEIDPGIREVVLLLNSMGYHTIDSGDGVSKKGTPMEGCMMPYPNVTISVGLDDIVRTADSLTADLAKFGVRLGPDEATVLELLGPQKEGVQYGDGVLIDGHYDPMNRTGIVYLSGLDDQLLAKCRQKS